MSAGSLFNSFTPGKCWSNFKYLKFKLILGIEIPVPVEQHWKIWINGSPLHWRHNGRDSVSNHQHHDCLLNRLFRRISKKTSQLRVTGLCVGKSPGTGEFPAQMASNAENVCIWWRHHALTNMDKWLTWAHWELITAVVKRSNKHNIAYITAYLTLTDELWVVFTLQWLHNERDGVSNHQPHDCLFNRLFRSRSKKTSKHRVTGLCAWNSSVTGEFPAQMASNAEHVSIWWRHHEWGIWRKMTALKHHRTERSH